MDQWRFDTGIFAFSYGIEIGRCLGGSGRIYCGESDNYPYCCGDYSIIFPQVPHIVVNDSEPCVCEYLYVEPRLLLQKDGHGCDMLWQFFYIPQKLPIIIRREEYPVLHFFISRIFQEFHEKEPCIRGWYMVCWWRSVRR